MFNLRYHIASLVAVFLALAVGLLLGGVVVERGTLDRQRDTIVKSLQADFEKLSSENHELSQETERRQRFSEETLPSLLGGELEGRQVLVIVDPSRRDVTNAVSDALTLAGAEPIVLRLRVKDFGLGEARYASALPNIPTEDRAAGVDGLATAIATEWASSGPRPVTAKLRDAGVLDGDDVPPGPVAGVVIAASWDEDDSVSQADEVTIAVGEHLARGGVPVVAAETTDGETGCISAATARALSAVDDADEPEGAVSLVWVLAGKAEGYYGTRQGADAPFPKLGE